MQKHSEVFNNATPQEKYEELLTASQAEAQLVQFENGFQFETFERRLRSYEETSDTAKVRFVRLGDPQYNTNFPQTIVY